MSKPLSKKSPTKKTQSGEKVESNLSRQNTLERIRRYQEEVKDMSYEKSLGVLDQILDDLQKEDIPLEDIQTKYLKGKVYLEHCEELLSRIEQTTIEIDPTGFEIKE